MLPSGEKSLTGVSIVIQEVSRHHTGAFLPFCRSDVAQWLAALTGNPTVLSSILASCGTLGSEEQITEKSAQLAENNKTLFV
jgi:hypothetical protein